jgi:hypothetical protein
VAIPCSVCLAVRVVFSLTSAITTFPLHDTEVAAELHMRRIREEKIRQYEGRDFTPSFARTLARSQSHHNALCSGLTHAFFVLPNALRMHPPTVFINDRLRVDLERTLAQREKIYKTISE